ncbi:MAG: lectin-like protein, partial [Flavitalea sp.]
LRSVTFNTTSSVSTTRTITFEAGDGTLSYNSTNTHFYNYVSGSFSWTAAKADAASKSFFGLTGYLVTVTNSSENTFVNALSGKGWLGGSDEFSQINIATGATTYANQAASEGKWYWVTGPEKGTLFSNASTAVTYANWNSGEPNNSGSTEHYAENFWASGLWNDSQDGSGIGYVLEYGGQSSDPVVDIFHTRDITLIATKLQTIAASSTYQLHDVALFVDNAINVYSAGNLTDAKVTISGNFNSGDILSYTGSLPSGVTVSGSGYNTATGVLSFSGTTTPSNWQSLFRTVKFRSTSNVTGNRDITYSVGNLVANSNGHFYESIASTANWSTSKTNAAAKTYMGLSGYLATISSSTENDFIKQKLGTDAWIGLSDSYTEINAATGVTTYANQTASEGKWYWISGPEKGTMVTSTNAPNGSSPGTPVAGVFNNWNLGEPNNSSGNENYGEIYAASAPGKWNDLSGSASLQYVVEYGGLATDPVIFLSTTATVFNNAILPVTGLELSAKANGQIVDINFSTITEIHCDHFDILHSADGVSFAKIGTVAGHGDTYEKQKYHFVDNAPAAGLNYYRLQQVDIDGGSVYSTIKQVTVNASSISLAPNPATSQIVVTNNSLSNARSSLIIYNVAGKIMLRKQVSSSRTTVDINTFPTGVYVAEMGDAKTIQHLIFIKQ